MLASCNRCRSTSSWTCSRPEYRLTRSTTGALLRSSVDGALPDRGDGVPCSAHVPRPRPARAAPGLLLYFAPQGTPSPRSAPGRGQRGYCRHRRSGRMAATEPACAAQPWRNGRSTYDGRPGPRRQYRTRVERTRVSGSPWSEVKGEAPVGRPTGAGGHERKGLPDARVQAPLQVRGRPVQPRSTGDQAVSAATSSRSTYGRMPPCFR
jgi:hypothetical protein